MAANHKHKIKMFWGVDKHFPKFLNGHYFEVSANALWQKPEWSKKHVFIKRWYDPRFMLLDSGGYAFFIQHRDYPFSVEKYFKLIKHYKPLLWVPMDYACEPDILSEMNQTTNDRIEATLEKLKYFWKKDNGGLMPVIQGYSLKERINCFEKLLQLGYTKKLIAIGSLCAMKSLSKINEIITGLCEFADKERLNCKFHLFGMSKDYILKYSPLPERIFSTDTQSWQFFQKYKNRDKAFQKYEPALRPHLHYGYHVSNYESVADNPKKIYVKKRNK